MKTTVRVLCVAVALLWASAHDVSAEVREEAVSALAGMLRRRDSSTRA